MSTSSAPIPWKHVFRVLVTFAPLWVGATVLFGSVGVTYALLRNDSWTASQPLVVRDEANRSLDSMGRFGSQEQLKAAQETVLEMAKHHDVVRAALQRMAPPKGTSQEDWPTTKQVSGTAEDHVSVRAPHGSEFGTTEVIYLQVKADSPERAETFCELLFQSLSDRLRTVRRIRADSVVEELSDARDLARAKLDDSAERLRTIEIEFGSDLSELRSLSDSISANGTNRRVLDETLKELQTAELELEGHRSLYELLLQGRDDPQKLLVSSGELLGSQPSLLRLKGGLIDAQLLSSKLSGVYTPEHPRLRAAVQTEREIREQLQLEVTAVMEAMRPVLSRAENRVRRLQEKKSQLEDRLAKLAHARTQYAELSAEVAHRTTMLAEAEAALSDAQANQSAAHSTSLLAALGPPLADDTPEGPSGGLLSVGATAAGLLFGLGTVFLIAPGPSGTTWGRRWTDVMVGRRATDFQAMAGALPRQLGPPGGIERRQNGTPPSASTSVSPGDAEPNAADSPATS